MNEASPDMRGIENDGIGKDERQLIHIHEEPPQVLSSHRCHIHYILAVCVHPQISWLDTFQCTSTKRAWLWSPSPANKWGWNSCKWHNLMDQQHPSLMKQNLPLIVALEAHGMVASWYNNLWVHLHAYSTLIISFRFQPIRRPMILLFSFPHHVSLTTYGFLSLILCFCHTSFKLQ